MFMYTTNKQRGFGLTNKIDILESLFVKLSSWNIEVFAKLSAKLILDLFDP